MGRCTHLPRLVGRCASMAIAAVAAVLTLGSGITLAAPVTWTGLGGDALWSNVNNWSPVGLPGAADDVTIPAGAPAVSISAANVTVQSLDLQRGLSLAANRTLTLTTASLAGVIALSGGSTLSGTYAIGAGGNITFPARCSVGRLSNVTINGDLPSFTGGMRWNNVTLNGTLTAIGAGSSEIVFEGTQTITGTIASTATGSLILSSNANGTLTIAAGAKVQGGNIEFNRSSPCLGGGGTYDVVNNGTIDANVAGRGINFNTSNAVAVTNNGAVNINGGTLTLAGFSGAGGSLTLNSGTLQTGGTFNPIQFGTFTRTGGTASIFGVADLASGTWTPTGTWSLAPGGTVQNGTVNLSSGTFAFPARCSLGRLSNVTLNGDIPSFTGGVRWNNVTLNGTITAVGAGSSEIVFEGSQTITGTIASAATGSLILSSNANGTLTIAAGAKVQGGNIDFDRSSPCLGGGGTYDVINNGTIDANIAGRVIDFNTASATPLTNNGTINVNDGTLELSSFTGNTGSLNLNSGILYVNGGLNALGTFSRAGGTGGTAYCYGINELGGGTWTPLGVWNVFPGATIQNGTINLASGTLAFPARCSVGRLSNVTINGNLPSFAGGMRWNNVTLNGTLTCTGNGEIVFEGSQTITGTIAANTTASLILSSNANGTLTIAPGAKIQGGAIEFYRSSPCLSGGGTYNVVNNGTIDANIVGRLIDFNTSSGVPITNNGTINVNGGTVELTTLLGAGGTVNLNSGTLYATGTLNTIGNFARAGGTGGTAIAYGTCDLGGGTWTPLGVWNVFAGASIENGTINLASGTLAFPARCSVVRLSTVTINGNLPNFAGGMRWNNVTLNGTLTCTGNGEIVFEGSQTITGTIAANTTASLILSSNANGTLTIAPGAKIQGGAIEFYRSSPCLGGGGTYDVVNNGTIDANIAGRFIDFNTSSAVPITNNGTLAAGPGTVELFGLTNNGTAKARAGAAIALGNAAHTLTSAGTFEVELKGPPPSTANFGRITLSNNAASTVALGGTLKIRNVAAYTPTCGLEWNIVTSALVAAGTPITGTFATFDFPFAGEGNLQRVTYEPKRVAFFIATQADFNEDGFITFEDFDEFVSSFEAGEGRSDFNADGFLTFEDFDAFVAKFEGGC